MKITTAIFVAALICLCACRKPTQQPDKYAERIDALGVENLGLKQEVADLAKKIDSIKPPPEQPWVPPEFKAAQAKSQFDPETAKLVVPASEIGRFQLVYARSDFGTAGTPDYPIMYRVDTVTGKTWKLQTYQCGDVAHKITFEGWDDISDNPIYDMKSYPHNVWPNIFPAP